MVQDDCPPPSQSSVFRGYLYVNWLCFYVSVFMLNILELNTHCIENVSVLWGSKLQADC
jgi:hypothetical protein